MEDPAALARTVWATLDRYPAGVLVEDYVPGRDVTVPCLEAVDNGLGGVLCPVEYEFDRVVMAGRRHRIYEYDLKTALEDRVSVRAPAALPPETAAALRRMTLAAVRLLGCRDVARVDFRIRDDGAPFFLEVNAVPTLAPGVGLYAAAAQDGLGFEDALEAIVASAAARQGLSARPPGSGRSSRRP